ncbi:Trk family potassium uptake protein [Lactococcus lactis]|uniref:TrkH family potassium uptake protein n=1 Tax=Lactococcus lactis subsp. cremoris TaxID=1359 RepID=UPI00117BAA27|nr:potassium transporter TrkG [Lactococcus cremoris]MCT0506908.1 Trk family potassium uptake protein [Lactococcus cremoris]TRW52040.1 Trk family potassium uptake protein [Lactococcus lactis]
MVLFKTLTYSQKIVLGFILLGLIGTILLALPISSKTGNWTPLLDSLFTSISALCVTGLTVYDTFTHWSFLGQLVILCLIQVGGIGFMTVIISISTGLGHKIGLHERQLLVESSGLLHSANLSFLVKRITIFVIMIEAIGAALLSIRFIPEFGIKTGIYYGVFHSISAFCNAGFDLMGRFGKYSSLTPYSTDSLVILTVSILIFLGGLGFIVWDDILRYKLNFKKYSLHTKIVLITSIAFTLVGSILFLLIENNHIFKEVGVKGKILSSLFLSISPRTAGFNAVDLPMLTNASIFLTILLMIVGGSSGSTAGGLKVTTVAVLFFSAFDNSRRRPTSSILKRRFSDNTIKQASAMFTFYLIIGSIGALILSSLNSSTLEEIIFEVFSALGTVGITLGITPNLGALSKITLVVLMFVGRVGWMLLIFAIVGRNQQAPISRVSEEIIVG